MDKKEAKKMESVKKDLQKAAELIAKIQEKVESMLAEVVE